MSDNTQEQGQVAPVVPSQEDQQEVPVSPAVPSQEEHLQTDRPGVESEPHRESDSSDSDEASQ